MIKIIAMPQASNPYQTLLYGSMGEQATVAYAKSSRWIFCTYPLLLVRLRVSGYRLIHLHWLYWLSVPYYKTKIGRFCSGANIRIFLLLSRVLGYKIVWTVHNILPHEPQTLDDLSVARLLSKHAARCIVHSRTVLDEMHKLELDSSRTVIIPHGNYMGFYPSKISRKTAREKLGIKAGETVILFFGLIRPYKGVEDLVAAFNTISRTQNATHLIIAGECDDTALKQRLNAIAADNVDFLEGHIPDTKIATYLKACDIVCLPFRSITTSGSALLALSFSKPIIAPYAGTLREVPKEAGYFYEPTQKNGLRRSLQSAVSNKTSLRTRGKVGGNYAKTLDWKIIARDTLELYRNALGKKFM